MEQKKTNFLQRIAQRFSGQTLYISDPAFAGYIEMSRNSLSEMSELIALRQPAVWAAVKLIAGTIASLPLNTYRRDENGELQQVKSFLDNPAPMGLTRFNWMELIIGQLLLNGEVGLLKIFNQAGALVQLLPVYMNNYSVKWDGSQKIYSVVMGAGKTQTFDSTEFVQVMGFTIDGLRGISPLTQFRRSIQLSTALETAATRSMTNGTHMAGLVTPDEDVTEDDAKDIQAMLSEKLEGPEQTNKLAFVNRKLKFQNWQPNNVDLQFLEMREFSITEVARIFQIPPHLLQQTTKETSWGSGIMEQNRSFAQFTLKPWTARLEEEFSRLLPSPRFCEFDYHELLAGTPTEEINALMVQTGNKPILSVNEARKRLNLPPVPGGDELAPAAMPPVPEAAPAKDVQQKASKPINSDDVFKLWEQKQISGEQAFQLITSPKTQKNERTGAQTRLIGAEIAG